MSSERWLYPAKVETFTCPPSTVPGTVVTTLANADASSVFQLKLGLLGSGGPGTLVLSWSENRSLPVGLAPKPIPATEDEEPDRPPLSRSFWFCWTASSSERPMAALAACPTELC